MNDGNAGVIGKSEVKTGLSVLTILMLANTISPRGTMGGNTKIFLEFARRWARAGHLVKVITYEEGLKTCQDYGLTNVSYTVVPTSRFMRFGLAIFYVVQIIATCIAVLRAFRNGDAVIYSSSNFWPDVIPGLLMKKTMPRSIWVGTCYLVSPHPLKRYELAYGKKWASLLAPKLVGAYLMERITNLLLLRYADGVLVTNDLDKKIFMDKGLPQTRMRAIYGGVDLREIAKVPAQKIVYDGCFVGRIHPQKGVIYLVKIWDRVRNIKPDARLVVIGNGPKRYERKVAEEIKKRKLDGNIQMLGFVDGLRKYQVLKASRVFLHTSIYDNCGMAAAEAMACGLPVVMFDIPALTLAYPRGVLTAPLEDCESFATRVLQLINGTLYTKLRQDALDTTRSWDWDRKADETIVFIKSLKDNRGRRKC